MTPSGATGPASTEGRSCPAVTANADPTELEIQESHRQAPRLAARLGMSPKGTNGVAPVTPFPLGETIETGIVAVGTAKQRAMPPLALHRDAPVICANPACGRRVKRRSRRQKYCSDRCRQMTGHYTVKPVLGGDTRNDRNPPKKVNVSNVLHGTKSRSDLIRNAVQTELFAGREWERVVSPDGVVALVTRLRRPAYSSRRT